MVPKKIPVSVLKIFEKVGTEKSIGIGIVKKFGYRHTLAGTDESNVHKSRVEAVVDHTTSAGDCSTRTPHNTPAIVIERCTQAHMRVKYTRAG